jgi:hypothetical protein
MFSNLGNFDIWLTTESPRVDGCLSGFDLENSIGSPILRPLILAQPVEVAIFVVTPSESAHVMPHYKISGNLLVDSILVIDKVFIGLHWDDNRPIVEDLLLDLVDFCENHEGICFAVELFVVFLIVFACKSAGALVVLVRDAIARGNAFLSQKVD